MKNVVFFDVDTQRDLMRSNGALYVPEAQDIIPRVTDLMEYAVNFGIPVVSTMDTHTKDDPEFQMFAPHCIKGTAGWEKLEGTLLPDRAQLSVDWTADLPDDIMEHQQIIIEKNGLDPFMTFTVHKVVERLNRPRALVFGVATDYCVRYVVLGLLHRKCKVAVILNATRPLRESSGRDAIEEMKARGAEFITTADVIRVAV
ncbi:MAG TPA: isochorismatase family cysteine hydrolase [Planctomycetota bacterium]|nr:isochorismatase family cysteine hydrolase [Planctomycetota bacterium]